MDFTVVYINSYDIYFGKVHAQGKINSTSHSLLVKELLLALPSGPLGLLLELSAAEKSESSSLWTECVKNHQEGKSLCHISSINFFSLSKAVGVHNSPKPSQ